MHETAAMMAHRRSGGEVRPYVRSSKPRFNWTGELKLLFEEAMKALGGTKKATPKQIRELMKCPDIQLSHIKSRLQMCRIRMEEKQKRSGSNSSSEVQGRSNGRERAADNNDFNGDDHSVVVDENEPIDSPPSHHHPFKRLRVEVQHTASSFKSNQYYFDYFGERKECCAVVVPQFSAAAYIFREEQSNPPKKEKENDNKRGLNEEEEEEELKLTLSLSMPRRTNKINLDLTLSFP